MKRDLLSHQKKVIKYFASKCYKQHGLLMVSQMGTGKTMTGVYFAKNYPNSRIIIIIPRGIENIWITEFIGADIPLENVMFITYKELKNNFNMYYENGLFKNAILLIDEAHNLINILDSFSSSSIIDKNFDKNKGKLIEKKKTITNDQKHSLIVILDLFKKAKKILFLTGTPIKNDLRDMRWFINIAAGKRLVPYNKAEFTNEYLTKDIGDIIINGWIQNIINLEIFGYKVIPMPYRLNFSFIQHYEDNLRNILNTVVMPPVLLSIMNYFKTNKNKNKNSNLPDMKTHMLSFIVLCIITRGMYIVFSNVKEYYSNNIAYDSLNSGISIASPYLFYYKYSEKDSNYPKYTVHKKKVFYTDYQLELWTRLVYGMYITDIETTRLDLTISVEEAQLFKPTSIGESLYLNNGRIIGNLDDDKKRTKKHNEYPIKFIKIMEMYKKNPTSTLVYSNFYHSGMLELALFFEKHDIEYTLYTPFLSNEERNHILDEFKNKRILILLIHPVYFEGFSVLGVRVFHILEPINEYYKQEQLYARAIRFNSHIHLPVSERHVSIYQWQCTLSNVFDKIRQQKHSINNWLKNGLYTMYFSYYSEFSTFFSPDDIVANNVNLAEKKINVFSEKIKQNSIDNNIKDTCCIYGDKSCHLSIPSCISFDKKK